MNTGRCRGVAVVALAVLTLAALVSAQITFSRDWTAGKRAAPSQPALDCAQFTRLCRHFVHEMKAAMSAEMAGATTKHRRVSVDEPSLQYDDEK